MDIVIGMILFLIGLGAGIYGTIVGAGGGFIFVPAILVLLHLPPNIAAGTGLAVVLINSVSGLSKLMKQKRIDFPMGWLLFLGAIPGTFMGVWLNQLLPADSFSWIFAFVLILLGLFLFAKKEPRLGSAQQTDLSGQEASAASAGKGQALLDGRGFSILGIGCLLGTVSGFFGIGGGWLLVPMLIYLFRVPPHIATATSIFSLCLYAVIGVGIHWFLGNIDWRIVFWGGAGVFLGAQLGVYLSSKLTGRRIVQMLAVLLVAIGVEMLLK